MFKKLFLLRLCDVHDFLQSYVIVIKKMWKSSKIIKNIVPHLRYYSREITLSPQHLLHISTIQVKISNDI